MASLNLIVDDLHVTGVDEGRGPVALGLHGWGNDHASLLPLARQLGGYRWIIPDLPGFGGSQNPGSAWDIAAYADWVVKLLVKLEIKETELVIGHSFGGRMALVLAGEQKLKLNRLVLIASHGLPEPLSPRARLLSAGAALGRWLPSKIRQRAAAKFGSPDYQAASGVMRQIFRQVITQDASDQARHIQVPTLLIYARDDKVTPVAMGERLSQLIAGSKLEIVDGGHHAHVEQPAAAELIKEFVDA